MKVTPNNPLAEFSCFQGIAIATVSMVALAFLTGNNGMQREEEKVRVAMIGNSLMYYNDLPRLLEAMSNGRLSQDGCLHGSASFKSHLLYGNGMFVKWDTIPAMHGYGMLPTMPITTKRPPRRIKNTWRPRTRMIIITITMEINTHINSIPNNPIFMTLVPVRHGTAIFIGSRRAARGGIRGW